MVRLAHGGAEMEAYSHSDTESSSMRSPTEDNIIIIKHRGRVLKVVRPGQKHYLQYAVTFVLIGS